MSRITRGRSDPAFSVEGPLHVDLEDLSPTLAASVVGPRWLVELSVPAGARDVVWKMANRVGRRLADEMDGVLFDPQEDRIVWPRSKQRRNVDLRGSTENSVEFEWAIPSHRFDDNLTVELLELLRRLLPEALPRRYGTFEPLQHRLEDGEEQFHVVWREESDSGVGMMFWKANKPVRGGLLVRPSSQRLTHGLRGGSIRIDVDARVFNDPRWRDLAVTILDRVGFLATAFAARALVAKHWPGGMPATEFDQLPPPMVGAGSWLGLPDHPAWMTWLPDAYTEAFDTSGYKGSIRRVGNGSIVVLADMPQRSEDLLPWSTRFPAEYCRRPSSPQRSRDSFLERRSDLPLEAATSIPFSAG